MNYKTLPSFLLSNYALVFQSKNCFYFQILADANSNQSLNMYNSFIKYLIIWNVEKFPWIKYDIFIYLFISTESFPAFWPQCRGVNNSRGRPQTHLAYNIQANSISTFVNNLRSICSPAIENFYWWRGIYIWKNNKLTIGSIN